MMLYVSFYVFMFFRMFLLLFFFKQKTAYEMRISDWSSDVCSSDLRWATTSAVAMLASSTFLKERRAVQCKPFGETGLLCAPKEIGRASCRERVCQYV